MKLYCMRCVARLLIPLLVMLNSSPWVIAAEKEPLSDTRILHQPLESTPSGVRVPVTVTVEDSAGVDVVRAYFKSTVGTIYYYIALTKTKDNTYSGKLPAPATDAGAIEYLILVKNKNNIVVKSQQYQTPVAEKPGNPEAGQETIKIYSESPHASKHILGFTNGYDFKIADPSEKYGVVAGLYNPESVSWIATDAVPGGTVTEPEEKNWNPYLIGGGIIAGIGVAALALGGGGGGGGGSTTPPADDGEEDEEEETPTPPQAPLASGTWRLTSYQNTSACTSGSGQNQTVTCSAARLFETVSPATLTVSVPDTATPDTCLSGTTPGLAEVFRTGQACDAEFACNSFSPGDLTSKTCGATSIRIVRNNGNHIQVWAKQ